MTSKLVHQRIRNRIIEMLEWILESSNKVPTLGFNALINSWFDWINDSVDETHFPSEIYSNGERELLKDAHSAIDAFCDATPDSIPDNNTTLKEPEWLHVIATSKMAYEEFMKKGRFSEEKEITDSTWPNKQVDPIVTTPVDKVEPQSTQGHP